MRDKLEKIIRGAGEIILSADTPGEIFVKPGDANFVTEYDLRVQEYLYGALKALLPEAGFLGEEDLGENASGSLMWVVDPIDGTMNFVKGFRHSCISAAYASRGTVLAAAVYNPYMDEMFTAVKGQGAWLNGKPIRAEDAPLSDCVVSCGTAPYVSELTDRTFDIMRECCRAGLDIRRQGAAALDLCSVASGRAGLFVELSLSLWDYAAGKLLVEEAGGVCLTEDGKELLFTSENTSILAGGKNAVKDYFELVRPGT